mgnify:CR=1 FL=1
MARGPVGRRIHPDEVIAAIQALAVEGVSGPEIRRRLAAGEVEGVKPYKISLRTVQDWAQRARRDLGPLPEDAIDAVNAIENMALRICMRDVKRLDLKNREELLTKAEHDTLSAALKTAQAIRASRRKREAEANPDRAKGGKRKAEEQRAKPATLLERIAKSGAINGSDAQA